MKRIYMNVADDSACSYYRAVLPVKHCSRQLATDDIELVGSKYCTDEGDFDVYVFHKVIKPYFTEVIEKLKDMGKKIVWETDDDCFSIPTWNPAHKGMDEEARDTLDWCLDLADAIVVSTEPLKRAVGRPDKTVVLPNLVDLASWPQQERTPNEPLRILWAGSVHHRLDLEEVVEPLDCILHEFGQRVQIFFMGDLPDKMAEYVRIAYCNLGQLVPARRYGDRLGFIEPVALDEYPAVLRTIQPDIALCPLTDCLFNHSKSNIKWLEMTLAGAAVVATDLPSYQSIKDGETGLLVKPGDSQGWYAAIKTLIADDVKRDGMAFLASLDVRENYAWDGEKRHKWLNFLKSLCV